MRYLAIAAVMILATASTVNAETNLGLMGGGVRAGFRIDPDQFLVGGQLDLGDFATNLRFMPNASIGFGDNVTLISVNPEVHYVFRDNPVADGMFFYTGGGLDIIHWSVDLPEPFDNATDTDLGLSLVGGIELELSDSQSLLGEIRIVFEDESFFELVGGWNFDFSR